MHGIIKLIAQYFSRTDNDRGFGVFLAVAGENADIFRAENAGKLGILGIAQGLQGTCIPAKAVSFPNPGNGLLCDPCFTGSGGNRHQAVRLFDGLQGTNLKWVRRKRPAAGYTDGGKNFFQPGIGTGLQIQRFGGFAGPAF